MENFRRQEAFSSFLPFLPASGYTGILEITASCYTAITILPLVQMIFDLVKAWLLMYDSFSLPSFLRTFH